MLGRSSELEFNLLGLVRAFELVNEDDPALPSLSSLAHNRMHERSKRELRRDQFLWWNLDWLEEVLPRFRAFDVCPGQQQRSIRVVMREVRHKH